MCGLDLFKILVDGICIHPRLAELIEMLKQTDLASEDRTINTFKKERCLRSCQMFYKDCHFVCVIRYLPFLKISMNALFCLSYKAGVAHLVQKLLYRFQVRLDFFRLLFQNRVRVGRQAPTSTVYAAN